MYIYEVSTGCYSNESHTILAHNTQFSPEEFSEICKKATITHRDSYSRNEEAIVSALCEKFGFELAEVVYCHFWDYASDEPDFRAHK